jgi:asparagine synthase (glutamine-hydrolysing)
MCGIAGFAGNGDPTTLEKMAGTLARRGPDDHGVYHDGHIGLTNTRLSVIDLSPLGHQPMANESGEIIVVFNGEIYNFKELRAQLEETGRYKFRSHSDTEVLLHLYESYGEESFKLLRGMFAIALYDKRQAKLFLVRDHLGKKPLYWGLFQGTLVFGSELKALMCHPLWQGVLDKQALNLYLVYESVPTPWSIFEGVKKLPPASYLVFKNGAVEKIVEFWRPAPARESDMDFESAKALLDKELTRSVGARLVADVPVGVFLSGGLDSSTVAYYAKLCGPVKTFSIGFDDESFDETREALAVARFLGTDHTSEVFSAGKCVDMIHEVAGYLDEPNADPSLLPTYLLSAFTRTSVTVALGGDGADELFAGYPTFRAESLYRYYSMIPKALRTGVIEPLIRGIPVSHSYMSLDFRLKKFLDGSDAPDRYRHQRWMGAFRDDERACVLTGEFLLDTWSPYAHSDGYWDAPGGDFYRRLLFTYLRTYLMDQVMAKVDRASMANSLETRSPFLDVGVVELALGFPYDFKYRNFTGKRILRDLMRRKLPPSVTERKKKGFGVPIGRWLQRELKPLCEDVLSASNITRSGIFNAAYVEKLKQEHFSGVADHRKKLWSLMVFMLWHDRWCDR